MEEAPGQSIALRRGIGLLVGAIGGFYFPDCSDRFFQTCVHDLSFPTDFEYDWIIDDLDHSVGFYLYVYFFLCLGGPSWWSDGGESFVGAERQVGGGDGHFERDRHELPV